MKPEGVGKRFPNQWWNGIHLVRVVDKSLLCRAPRSRTRECRGPMKDGHPGYLDSCLLRLYQSHHLASRNVRSVLIYCFRRVRRLMRFLYVSIQTKECRSLATSPMSRDQAKSFSFSPSLLSVLCLWNLRTHTANAVPTSNCIGTLFTRPPVVCGLAQAFYVFLPWDIHQMQLQTPSM